MKRIRVPIAAAYALLALTAVLSSTVRWPFRDGVRAPVVALHRDPAQSLDGLVPAGLWQIDAAQLHSSINRLAAVRLGRELGNSVRLALGQRVEWIIWGDNGQVVLFPTIDLWVSRGLTPEVETDLARAARIIAQYQQQLAKEGWTLVVVPVPTKMAIHRELVKWPVQGANLTSRDLIPADRSDEVYASLVDQFRQRGVDAVNLQAEYRHAVARHPRQLLYASNDSHWGGEGIRLAAKATAAEVSKVSPIKDRTPAQPTYLEVEHVGDLAKAFDPLPAFTTWLRPAWVFHDRLINGESGRGYTYATKPDGLIVAVGTSYTGQYTWLENQPVGFTWQVGLHLRNVEIQNRPVAGQGSFFAFEQFWRQREAISSDFDAKNGQGLPKVLIWEFPVRDIKGIAEAGSDR